MNMTPPGKLSGSSPLVPWLNRLRDYIVSTSIRSVSGAKATRQKGVVIKR